MHPAQRRGRLPATGVRRPATGDRRPATGDRRSATGAFFRIMLKAKKRIYNMATHRVESPTRRLIYSNDQNIVISKRELYPFFRHKNVERKEEPSWLLKRNNVKLSVDSDCSLCSILVRSCLPMDGWKKFLLSFLPNQFQHNNHHIEAN